MTSDADRRRVHEQIKKIDAAFRAGDLAALRAAVDDPDRVPNGPMPLAIGPCLEYVIYHSPLPFILSLLEIGANPNTADHAGFPPLIAALSCSRPRPGSPGRPDTTELLALLLSFGADPNQRGINDYTPLHMAVGERNLPAVRLLLDAGADPHLRTRIDDCETPGEMAEQAGLHELAALLAAPAIPMKKIPGVRLLEEREGAGAFAKKGDQVVYNVKIFLNQGEEVRLNERQAGLGLPAEMIRRKGDQTFIDHRVTLGRRQVIPGIERALVGMKPGGYRKVRIGPHLAYRDKGVPGLIPADAVLVIQIWLRDVPNRGSGG
jgi:uncharacterized protein